MLAVSIKVKSVKAGRVIISEDARDKNFTYEGETITPNVRLLAEVAAIAYGQLKYSYIA